MTINSAGVAVVAWCAITLIVLIGGLFNDQVLVAAFMLFVIGAIPAVIGLFFIKFESPEISNE